MTDERSTLEVGRIVKAHGLKGQVIVDLWTDRDERLAKNSELQTARGPMTVQAATRHQERWIVTFAGVTTREEADALRGVVLSAAPLEDDDAIWIHELFGALVVDQTGRELGRVVDVEANPASDLLVLESGALIPLTFVTAIEANERIDVDIPDGLLEEA
jgi:16S rRNA processing protein RimM